MVFKPLLMAFELLNKLIQQKLFLFLSFELINKQLKNKKLCVCEPFWSTSIFSSNFLLLFLNWFTFSTLWQRFFFLTWMSCLVILITQNRHNQASRNKKVKQKITKEIHDMNSKKNMINYLGMDIQKCMVSCLMLIPAFKGCVHT